MRQGNFVPASEHLEVRASRFVADIRRARRKGLLPKRFRGGDLRQCCPGWSDHTYTNFLPKHRLGNPGGYTAYFERHRDGTYSLLEG